jgi:hypothetical protein
MIIIEADPGTALQSGLRLADRPARLSTMGWNLAQVA